MTITKRSTSDFPRRLTSIEIRAKCIEEILTTEREYVQHLRDIVEVFVVPLRVVKMLGIFVDYMFSQSVGVPQSVCTT